MTQDVRRMVHMGGAGDLSSPLTVVAGTICNDCLASPSGVRAKKDGLFHTALLAGWNTPVQVETHGILALLPPAPVSLGRLRLVPSARMKGAVVARTLLGGAGASRWGTPLVEQRVARQKCQAGQWLERRETAGAADVVGGGATVDVTTTEVSEVGGMADEVSSLQIIGVPGTWQCADPVARRVKASGHGSCRYLAMRGSCGPRRVRASMWLTLGYLAMRRIVAREEWRLRGMAHAWVPGNARILWPEKVMWKDQRDKRSHSAEQVE
ncbi:hypothetical protein CYMTET_56879 [Cymbomonas tetramitiformis]|uniref:Uncharacterized protein n=1 Tax=Cymbomonas tetramitiformis TaxID=36881 RepID=A0AAE0BA09_9CHLO|nr:hypothetical protein CYMTET_56879 [Cymbomonas tetramitiformis]